MFDPTNGWLLGWNESRIAVELCEWCSRSHQVLLARPRATIDHRFTHLAVVRAEPCVI